MFYVWPVWYHQNVQYPIGIVLVSWHYYCGDLRLVSCSTWLLLRNCHTVYPKKYAHSFVVLCFVVVMQSFIMNSHEVFIHIHQGCFAGTGAIARLPQCQWSKPDGYGKISQCITTTQYSKAKTVCIFLGIYCITVVKHYCEPTLVQRQFYLRHTLQGYHRNCLYNNLFRITIMNTLKLHITTLCEGTPSVINEFPSQRVSNVESGSMLWHHHDIKTQTHVLCMS